MLNTSLGGFAIRACVVAAIAAAAGLALAAAGTPWTWLPAGQRPASAIQTHDARVEYPPALSNLDEPIFHMAADASSGDLWFGTFVPEDARNPPGIGGPKLYHYQPAGERLTSFALPRDTGTGLWSAVAVDYRGHVLVAYGYSVVDFDPTTTEYVHVILPSNTKYPLVVPDQVGTWASAMAVDPKGRVFVARMSSAALTEVDFAGGSTVEYPFTPSIGPIVDMEATAQGIFLTNWFGFGFSRQTALFDPATGQLRSLNAQTSNLAASQDGTVYGTSIAGQGVLAIDQTGARPVTPAALEGHLEAAADLLALDDADNAIWFAAQGAGTIARWDRSDGSVSIYQLPSQVVPGELSYCIDTVGPCPKELVLTTVVGALAPDGKGNVYFADQTRSAIGIAHPD